MKPKELIKKLLSVAVLLFSVLIFIGSAVEAFSSFEVIPQLIINAIVIFILLTNKLSIDIKRDRLTNFLLTIIGIGIFATPFLLIYTNSFREDNMFALGPAIVLLCYRLFGNLFDDFGNSPIKTFDDYARTYSIGVVMWCLSAVAMFAVLITFSTEPSKSEFATIWVFVVSILVQFLYLGIIIAKHKSQNYIWVTSLIYLGVTIPMFFLTLFIIGIIIIAIVAILVFNVVLHTASSTSSGNVDMNSASCCANCGNWRGGVCVNNRNVLNPDRETCAQYYRG